MRLALLSVACVLLDRQVPTAAILKLPGLYKPVRVRTNTEKSSHEQTSEADTF